MKDKTDFLTKMVNPEDCWTAIWLKSWFKEGQWKFWRVGNLKHLTRAFREMGEGLWFSSVQLTKTASPKSLSVSASYQNLWKFFIFLYFLRQFVSCMQEALIQCCCVIKTLGKHALDSELILSKFEPSVIQIARDSSFTLMSWLKGALSRYFSVILQC